METAGMVVVSEVWEWKDPALEIRKGSLEQKDLDLALPYTLMDYQVEGLLFLRNTKRAILADQTGLGKTITSLAAAKGLGKVLILCPKYVASKWVATAEKFGETVGVVGDSKKQKLKQAAKIEDSTEFVITNYETLIGKIEAIDSTKWDVIIVDEAQYLQGRGSSRTTAAKKLMKKVVNVWLLTATPVWNQPDSLWNLIHILYPKQFSSYWRFVNKYCIVKETPFGKEIKGHNPATAPELRVELKPFVLRRLKKEVLTLASRFEHEIWIDVDKRLIKESRNIRRLMRDYGRLSSERSRLHLLDRNSFDFLEDERLYKEDFPSAKFLPLCNVVKSHDGDKMLLFVFHRRSAQVALDWIKKIGVDWVNDVPITGEISVSRREELIREFEAAKGSCVLVGTIRTMGTGLDLQAATVAMFLEQTSMSTEMEQCEGRVERIGSVEAANIYQFIQKGTLDEKIYKACKEKQEISEAILLKDED